jgi:hypothetical protein
MVKTSTKGQRRLAAGAATNLPRYRLIAAVKSGIWR